MTGTFNKEKIIYESVATHKSCFAGRSFEQPDGKSSMTLDMAKYDQVVKIVNIRGGWGIRQRLHQMGLYEGTSIRVIRASAFGGPILIEHNLSKIALGRGMAYHIIVQGIDKDDEAETQNNHND